MKTPQSPPNWDGLSKENIKQQLELMTIITSPLVDGKYVHWDKLRRKKLPESIKNHKEWWGALKLRRLSQKKFIDLTDTQGRNFTFSIEDPIYEKHLFIDRHACGSIQLPLPIAETDMKQQYYVKSLIEEAITSSQMEGASTTRRVAKEMILNKRTPHDKSERMILNNYRTMEFINEIKNEPLSKELIFEIHRMISTQTLDEEDQVGRFRNQDEKVVVQDSMTGKIFHTPPDAKELEDRIKMLCDFANGETPDYFLNPVIRSIILHFWMAYDHPFVDGNGRVSRAIFYWSMLHHDYWLFQYVSISRILKMEQTRYAYSFLYTETDDNDLNYFLDYHLDVMERAIHSLHDFVKQKAEQSHTFSQQIKNMADFNNRQRELLQRALQHPKQSCTFKSHQTSHGIAYASARSDILDLVEMGLLNQYKVGRAMHFSPVQNLKELLEK